ncbi:hypothetical protein ACIRNU_32905 [Streptomyces rochei]|uniref:hypothetical protein n=1 Tax=Streptomyces rochei TaxID=1928 RepID=UPI0038160EA6
MAGLLRRMAAEERAGGSGSRWRAAVSAEQRSRIEQSIAQAREQSAALRACTAAPPPKRPRTLLEHLSRSTALIDQALVGTAAAGVALEDVAAWARLPARELADIITSDRDED